MYVSYWVYHFSLSLNFDKPVFHVFVLYHSYMITYRYIHTRDKYYQAVTQAVYKYLLMITHDLTNQYAVPDAITQ